MTINIKQEVTWDRDEASQKITTRYLGGYAKLNEWCSWYEIYTGGKNRIECNNNVTTTKNETLNETMNWI